MHKNTHRAAAFLLSAALLTGCGTVSSTEPAETSAAPLPYGATVTELLTGKQLPVRYDDRYLSEEAADAALRYYTAIQNNDTALFSEMQFPLWKNYFLSQVLGGQYTDEDILHNTHTAMQQYVGGEFEYALIDITDSVLNDGYQASQNIVQLLDDLSADQGGGVISEDISAFYELTITRYLAKKGTNQPGETDTALLDEKLFVFCHKNQWYIIYN